MLYQTLGRKVPKYLAAHNGFKLPAPWTDWRQPGQAGGLGQGAARHQPQFETLSRQNRLNLGSDGDPLPALAGRKASPGD
jgi:hypothetical protein